MKSWRRVEQFFKHRVLRLFEAFLGKAVISPRDVNSDRITRILVVRTHDQLGDFLLSTPVFKALKTRFPWSSLCVIAHDYTTPLVVHNQFVDSVLTFHENFKNWRVFYAIRLFRALYKKFDLVVVLNTVSHSLTSDLIATLTRAPFVLGTDHLHFSGTRRNFFYNLISPQKRGRHQTLQNLDIVRYIGADTDDYGEHMRITDQEKQNAQRRLQGLGLLPDKPILAVHPGAGKVNNRWPVEKYAKLVQKCVHELDVQVFITWGPSESQLGNSLISLLNKPVYTATFERIRELAAVLSLVSVLVCNDTGVMHLCAAVKTPLVAIFGPTNPNEWKPRGKEFVAVYQKAKDCSSIPVQTVFDRCVGLLKKS